MAYGLEGQDGLVGYWSFDQLEAGRFADHSALGNSGSVIGATLQPGISGNGLYLDGKNDYAEILSEDLKAPGVFRDLGKGAISFWFRVEFIPLDHGIAPLF